MNWKFFCDQLDIAELVPDEYATFRRPIADAMVFFLEQLSPARSEEILHQLLASSDPHAVETQMLVLARNCPTLQKLGQLLARDRRLSAELRTLLQTLETMPPRACPRWIRETVVAELGSLEDHGIELADVPLAEASVAVVIPFTWPAPQDGLPASGVFKVLKPEIAERLNEELEILERVGEFLDERCGEYGLPRLDFADTFAQVNERLRHEVKLEQEQCNLVAAGRAYAGHREILVPQRLPFCSDRITAMERIDGQRVTELAEVSRSERHHLARVIVEALIAEPVWSRAGTLFHADPHAGNLFRTPDNRVALVDWSLVGRLSEPEVEGVAQILLGALTLDPERIAAAVCRLARRPCDLTRLRPVIDRALRAVRHTLLPGLKWLTEFLDESVRDAGVSFGTDLLMFRKALHTLEGVVMDVDDQCCVDAVLAASFFSRLWREWSRRLVAAPASRSFPTHLSNADLAGIAAAAPLTACRYWSGWLNEWLGAS